MIPGPKNAAKILKCIVLVPFGAGDPSLSPYASTQNTSPSTHETNPSTQKTIPSTQLTIPSTRLTDPGTRPNKKLRISTKDAYRCSTRIKDVGIGIRHSRGRILFYTAGSRNGLEGIGGRGHTYKIILKRWSPKSSKRGLQPSKLGKNDGN